ncbi:MAG: DegT/DnrJ/EryC1/StrS family aminotransferase, partial [Pseudomonadota bacterium]
MNIFKDIPPTAGFPVFLKEIAASLRENENRDFLAEDLKKYLQVPYARTTCSGTAALYLIGEAIKALSSKRTIIIPSFICPLVAFAVKRAGFNIAVCDIGKKDFNVNPADLEALCRGNSDVGAVIIDHLAGIPGDVDALGAAAKKYGLLVIEDCAQSLGARYKNRNVGTLGDFSFFSFAAGKGLTLYEGGMAVANSERYGALLHDTISRGVKNDFFIESLRVIELLGYWLFYRPELFWLV